jgi:hypothetical protein
MAERVKVPLKGSVLRLCTQFKVFEPCPCSWLRVIFKSSGLAFCPSRSTMLMVPAMARAPVSAVGARKISIRSTCSGVSESTENPGGMRSPSSKIWV